MALSREQSIAKYGTEAYTGWPETEAAYDAQAHPEKLNTYNAGGGNGNIDPFAGMPSASDIADKIISTVVDSLPTPPKYSDNPFSFDEALARESATAEVSPYYKNELNNFLTDIQTQRDRGAASEKNLLADLTTQRDENLAAAGLTFSGEKQRPLGQAGQSSPVSWMNDILSKARDTVQNTKNLFSDLTTTQNRGTQDINQAKQTAIEQGVLQRKSESLDSYLSNLQTQEQGVTIPSGVLGTILP